jgi:hypothetical protein
LPDQHVLSRREAIALLGMSAAAAGADANPLGPSMANAGAVGGEDIAARARSQYIFGYGSLIQRESRTRACASAEAAFPVIVRGVSRGWFDQTGGPSWNPTYLGAIPDEAGICNGVIFPVTLEEFAAYDKREVGYRPMKLDSSQISMLDGSRTAPDGDIWFYGNTEKKIPSLEHPIVQSYVDICLDGCLEIEATYPLARQSNFAEQFIKTSSHWQTPWVNDRIYPWRPFIYVPRASQIDSLIQKVLGRDIFDKITLK